MTKPESSKPSQRSSILLTIWASTILSSTSLASLRALSMAGLVTSWNSALTTFSAKGPMRFRTSQAIFSPSVSGSVPIMTNSLSSASFLRLAIWSFMSLISLQFLR